MQIAAVVAGIVWLVIKFWLLLTVPFGVTIDQASTGLAAFTAVPGTADRLFVSNFLAQAGIFKVLGLGELSLRIYGCLLLVVLIAGVMKGLKKTVPEVNPGLLLLILAVNPWLTNLSLFHLPELLSITAGVWMVWVNRWWIKLPLALIAAFASPVGMAGILIMTVCWFFKKQKVLALTIGAIILTAVFINRQYVTEQSKTLWINRLSLTEVEKQVNEEQKIYFLATNKSYMLPAWFRKLVFNKPLYIAKALVNKSMAILDPTSWTAAQDGWVITSLSGFPPRGVESLFYYWEVPLMVLGIITLKNRKVLLWIILAAIPAIFAEEKFIVMSGLWLLPAGAGLVWQGGNWLIGKGGKWVFLAGIILFSLAAGHFYRQLFYNQEDKLKSDTQIYRQMAKWTKENSDQWEKIVVTERMGPTKLMFAFYGLKDNTKLEFRDFDLTRENSPLGYVFVGLPGEFAGPGDKANDRQVNGRTILEKINYGDELVFNYGKGIWIGK